MSAGVKWAKKWLLQYEFDLSELGDKHRYIGSASNWHFSFKPPNRKGIIKEKKRSAVCFLLASHHRHIDLLLFSLLSAQSAREKYFLDVLSCEKLKLRPKNKCFCVKIMLHLFSQFSLVSLQSHEINCDLLLPVVT